MSASTRLYFSMALALMVLCATLSATAQDAAPEASPEETATQSSTADLPFVRPVPFSVILTEFKTQTGISIQTHGKMPNEAALAGDGMTVEQVLNSLASAHNLKWVRTPEGEYHLWSAEAYTEQYLPRLTEQKIFTPRNITAQYLKENIEKAKILTPGVGSISIDPRTNQLVVIDLPEVLAKVQDINDLIDVPLFTRVFYIRYAPIDTVVGKIERFKSEAGTIEVDLPGRLIIVEDTIQNIERMEDLIELLDKQQKRIIYNLNSLDLADTETNNLKTYLELLVSPESKYYVDINRGLLYLEDTPEVHEQLQEFMRLFTRTMDQVMIYAELLEVRQSSGFNYGTEFGVYKGVLNNSLVDLLKNIEGTGGILSGIGALTEDDTEEMDDEDDPFSEETPVSPSAIHHGGSLKSGASGLNIGYIWPISYDAYAAASFSAAMNDANTRVLLRPRLQIKSGETARIAAQSSNPLLEPVYDDDGDVTGYNTSFLEAGLFVDLEPSISPTGLIEMNISIENSDAQPVEIRVGTTESGNAQIRDSYRKTEDRVETTLIIPDGETRVISGLIRKDNLDSESGVPFLYKIPFLGPLLFGKKEVDEATRNLIFFVTPVIVREGSGKELIAHEFLPGEPTPYDEVGIKAPVGLDDDVSSATATDIFEGLVPIESLSPGAASSEPMDASELRATGDENTEEALRKAFGGKLPSEMTG
ncbi:MAG: secretin N-terminal domain-containing protein, partial [Candidatus Sumerlaeota bacterium]